MPRARDRCSGRDRPRQPARDRARRHGHGHGLLPQPDDSALRRRSRGSTRRAA